MTALCECGCGQPAPIATITRMDRGQVKGQPVRFIHGHNTRKDRDALYEERACGYHTPCWVWRGYVMDSGYGRINGRMAHREFYERYVGPISDSLQVDHLCRNPTCVNPGHLEAVPQTINVRRSSATSLTPDDVAAIRAAREELAAVADPLTKMGTPRRRVPGSNALRDALAARYGVTRGTIKAIWAGRRWAEGGAEIGPDGTAEEAAA